ncbi:MAG: biotin/lipoate--protein ligase family protein [Pseudomonadota bacterium]
MTDLSLPPLMTGIATAVPPFQAAQEMAAAGCDGGTVLYRPEAERLEAAVVLAPEVALEDAAVMLIAAGLGFANALGALAPPEVGVHLEWAGAIRVNGARCGGLRVAASTKAPDEIPDWLVIGIETPFQHQHPSAPGQDTETTALYEEGCAEITPQGLLEAWARHSLHWINRWEAEGNRPLHAEWQGLVHGLEEEIQDGTFVGTDARFGRLVRKGETVHLTPLSHLVEPR